MHRVVIGHKLIRLLSVRGIIVLLLISGGAAWWLTRAADPGGLIDVGNNPTAVLFVNHTHRLFVANNGDNTVTVLDTHNGTHVATTFVGAGPAALAIDPRGQHVIVMDTGTVARAFSSGLQIGVNNGSGGIDLLDARTGRSVRRLALGGFPQAMAVDQQTDQLFVACSGAFGPHHQGMLYIFDAASGRVQHRVTIGLLPLAITLDAVTGRALLSDATGRLYSVDTAAGQVRAVWFLGALPVAIAADAATRRVFVANQDSGDVLAIDSLTGRIMQRTHVGGFPVALAIDDRQRTVVVNTVGQGGVGLLDMATGRLRRFVRTGAVNSLALDHRGRAVVLNAQRHSVSVVEIARGAVVSTITLTAPPLALDLDARTGRAFVTMNSSSGAQDPWAWLPGWARSKLPLVPRPSPPVATPAQGQLRILSFAP